LINALWDANAGLPFSAESIKNNKEAREAVLAYLKKDLPEFIEKMVSAFLSKATPEQKKKFFSFSAS